MAMRRSAEKGTIHMDVPVNTAPANVLPVFLVNPLGHRVYAVMSPVVMSTATTADAWYGASHTAVPLKQPPRKLDVGPIAADVGQPLYAVIVICPINGVAVIFDVEYPSPVHSVTLGVVP